MNMRKTATVTLVLLSIALLFLTIIARYLFQGNDVVTVYNPPLRIASLLKDKPLFDQIDRTQPYGLIFAKTVVTNVSQVKKIYTDEILKQPEIMDVILNHELTDKFKKKWGDNKRKRPYEHPLYSRAVIM